MDRRGFIERLLLATGLLLVPKSADAHGIIMFHGGCHGCTQQLEQKEGTLFCAKECCYFEPDWSKPDMNNRPKTAGEIEKERIKSLMLSQ